MGLYATPHCTPLQRPGPRCSMAGGLCPQAPDSPGQSPPRALSPNGTGSQARLCLGEYFLSHFVNLTVKSPSLAPDLQESYFYYGIGVGMVLRTLPSEANEL